MARFYKAIEGTNTFEEYGKDLIPGWRVAMPEFGNQCRKEIEDAEPEDIARALREPDGYGKGYDEMELYSALCELADMSDEWENSGDNWGDVADSAANKLGVDI